MKNVRRTTSRLSILNFVVVFSLLVSLLGFSLDGLIIAQAASGPASNPAQEATATELPTDTPTETATNTDEPAPTDTQTPEPPTLAPTETSTSEATLEPSATQTPSGTPTPSAVPSQSSTPEPHVGVLASLIIPAGMDVVPDAYIVVFKPGINVALAVSNQRARIQQLGGQITFTYTAALQGYAAVLPGKALQEARANPLVDYVIADGVVTINDDLEVGPAAITTQNNATWGLDRIDQRKLPLNTKYKYNTTAPTVHVYVIDTGIKANHNEFGGRANKVFDAVGDGRNGNDCNGHGTHVAGTIGGTTYGVAKKVKLHAVRVLDCAGSGLFSQVIAGVDWVTLNHLSPAVANMSLIGAGNLALDTAIQNSIASGVVYVVAAGNSNADACNFSPPRVTQAITVGATEKSDARAYYSNAGSCLDLFAPGGDGTTAGGIKSAWIGSKTATNTISGTSMASPHVAGVAALYLAHNPTATPAQVATAIINGATTGKVTGKGAGSPNRLLFSRFGVLQTFNPWDFLVADLPLSSRELAFA